MATVTQVSWIDSDEVADLLRQLQGPAQAPQAGAWELHTQPLEPSAAQSVPAFSLAPDENQPPPTAALAPSAPLVQPSPFGDEVDSPELDRIRQQLRELRQRAQKAGVIQSNEPVPSSIPETEHAEPPTSPIVVEPALALPSPFSLAAPAPFVVPHGEIGDRLRAYHAWASKTLGTTEVLVLDSFGDVLEGQTPFVHLAISSLMAWQSDQRVNPAQAMGNFMGVERTLPNGGIMTLMPVHSRHGMVSVAVISPASLPMDLRDAVTSALRSAVEA
ncbi:MAG: hypothetical protein JNJ83_10155 [Verrucomicrobiaceae bacterium]|nr:hypothetical protein [Verrucomicrobiaceae bacterium]